jgi:hypothetical protein
VIITRTTFERWIEGDLLGTPRSDACKVLEHLLGEPAEILFGPPHPADAVTRVMTGPSPHLDAVASFRLADRQLGGGHVYNSLVLYLRNEIAPGLFGLAGSNGSEESLLAGAVLTEMAGWMAHDLGHDNVARGHFTSALKLAEAVGEPAVVANIDAGMSHLALQAGQAGEAANLAHRGLARLRTTEPVPVLTARLHAMKARAFARLDAPTQAQRSLDSAQEELHGADLATAPSWVAPFDHASLASETASVLLDLHRLPEAAEEAARALKLRDASRARSRALGQVTLARILIAQEQLDAACEISDELLGMSQVLGSVRVSRQLDLLQDAFEPYGRTSSVHQLLERMTAEARHRRLLLASLTVPEGLHE